MKVDERGDFGAVRSVCVLLLFMDAGVGNGVEHAFKSTAVLLLWERSRNLTLTRISWMKRIYEQPWPFYAIILFHFSCHIANKSALYEIKLFGHAKRIHDALRFMIFWSLEIYGLIHSFYLTFSISLVSYGCVAVGVCFPAVKFYVNSAEIILSLSSSQKLEKRLWERKTLLRPGHRQTVNLISIPLTSGKRCLTLAWREGCQNDKYDLLPFAWIRCGFHKTSAARVWRVWDWTPSRSSTTGQRYRLQQGWRIFVGQNQKRVSILTLPVPSSWSQWLLLVTDLVFCNNPKAKERIVSGFCRGNQDDVNFWVGLQRYIITAALYYP